MKKTVFHKIRRLFRFTLLVCLSLGVLSAKAQTARVTLKVQNASLGQVMDEIKNQTRYLFINQDVKDLNNHKVSLYPFQYRLSHRKNKHYYFQPTEIHIQLSSDRR